MEEPMPRFAPICAALIMLGAASPGFAQQPTLGTSAPNVKRSLLQKTEVPGSNHEVTVALLEVAANARIGRHIHPGAVVGYLLEGTYTVAIEGQPEKTIKSGESVEIPPGAVHDEWTGATPAKMIVVYTLEKGKPLASPAP
jgi:quercetin dioxygenase-like cupin family protein